MTIIVTRSAKPKMKRELPCVLEWSGAITNDAPLIVLFTDITTGFCISGAPSQINRIHYDWVKYTDVTWKETTVTLSSED